MKVTKAVLPVAGLGTRFLPASKAIPKEMVTVFDKPVIQYVVEEALAAGINEIVLVTHSSKKAIEDHFAPMSEAEAAGYEYSMMMKQYDAMLEDWNRREAEERAAKRAAEKAAKEAAEKGE